MIGVLSTDVEIFFKNYPPFNNADIFTTHLHILLQFGSNSDKFNTTACNKFCQLRGGYNYFLSFVAFYNI
jgi:hypothetical protein